MSVYEDIKTGLEQAISHETKAIRGQEDCLTITYDCSLPDYPTLCVGRIVGDNLKLVNILYGDEAMYTYSLLTGNVEWKDIKQ